MHWGGGSGQWRASHQRVAAACGSLWFHSRPCLTEPVHKATQPAHVQYSPPMRQSISRPNCNPNAAPSFQPNRAGNAMFWHTYVLACASLGILLHLLAQLCVLVAAAVLGQAAVLAVSDALQARQRRGAVGGPSNTTAGSCAKEAYLTARPSSTPPPMLPSPSHRAAGTKVAKRHREGWRRGPQAHQVVAAAAARHAGLAHGRAAAGEVGSKEPREWLAGSDARGARHSDICGGQHEAKVHGNAGQHATKQSPNKAGTPAPSRGHTESHLQARLVWLARHMKSLQQSSSAWLQPNLSFEMHCRAWVLWRRDGM